MLVESRKFVDTISSRKRRERKLNALMILEKYENGASLKDIKIN